MELQTLQEALKVEIQIHQVGLLLSGPLGQWVRRDRGGGGGGGRCSHERQPLARPPTRSPSNDAPTCVEPAGQAASLSF